MSRPIKPAYEVGKLTGAWLAFKEEFVSRRVGLDRYKHFGIVVNWRCFWALAQAVLTFEMFLAIVFTGRGWSLFGRVFETKVIPLIDNQVIWASICLIAAITGYGLWHNRRWAFLIESLLLAIFGGGLAIALFQHEWKVDKIGSYLYVVYFVIQAIAIPYQLYKRYRDFDLLNGNLPIDEIDQENPIPAKYS